MKSLETMKNTLYSGMTNDNFQPVGTENTRFFVSEQSYLCIFRSLSLIGWENQQRSQGLSKYIFICFNISPKWMPDYKLIVQVWVLYFTNLLSFLPDACIVPRGPVWCAVLRQFWQQPRKHRDSNGQWLVTPAFSTEYSSNFLFVSLPHIQ